MSQPIQAAPTRSVQIELLGKGRPFDIVVVGGGATGMGIALDAASRGYRVALCEMHDFGKGTSSRSTKLVHGGVRYLQQGNIRLVREALHERGLLLKNAPHVVYPLPTLVPLYSCREVPYYWAGLKAYDLLAGRLNIKRSRYLSPAAAQAAVPTIKAQGLCGGICYYDAGFDDTRLLIGLLQTAINEGALCINYVAVEALRFQQVGVDRKICGVVVRDTFTGQQMEVEARAVINAAGPFSDSVRRMDNPDAKAHIQPSQGSHLVLDRRFLPGDTAIIVPKTPDGRVIFAIPWHGHTLVGTTDTPLQKTPEEPAAQAGEIDYLLETVSGYLEMLPTRSDILSVFAGVRPLVAAGGSQNTSKLGRDHSIVVEPSGLISVLGGKWTTYRRMAQDAVDCAIQVAQLPPLACRTHSLPIGGDSRQATEESIEKNPEYAALLDPALPYSVADAIHAVRSEMAQTIEDVLSRRTRMLLLNTAAAVRAAPGVAKILASELGRDEAWIAEQVERFEQLAENYQAR